MQKFSAFLVVAIVLTIVSIGFIYIATQKWGLGEAVAVLIVDHRAVVSGEATKESWDSYIAYATSRDLQMITSDEVLGAVLNSPRIQNTTWFRGQPSLVAAQNILENNLDMNAVEGTVLVELSLRIDPPDESVVILDEVVVLYLDRKNMRNECRQAIENSRFRRLFLNDVSYADDRVRLIKEKIDRLVQGRELMPALIESAETNRAYQLTAEQQLQNLQRELEIVQAKESRIDLRHKWIRIALSEPDKVWVRLHSGPEWR